jgi:hypothetical protein
MDVWLLWVLSDVSVTGRSLVQWCITECINECDLRNYNPLHPQWVGTIDHTEEEESYYHCHMWAYICHEKFPIQKFRNIFCAYLHAWELHISLIILNLVHTVCSNEKKLWESRVSIFSHSIVTCPLFFTIQIFLSAVLSNTVYTRPFHRGTDIALRIRQHEVLLNHRDIKVFII